MTMCPVFPDHQKCYFKHFKAKQLFWGLLSSNCKDALNAICQTFSCLLDISLKHCFFSWIIYGDLDLSDLKTLLKGVLLIFLVHQKKLYYLHFHEEMNNIFCKATEWEEQRGSKSQENIFHMTPVWARYFSFHQGLW